MATPDAQTVLTKWKARTTQASQDYVDGVQNTDKDIVGLAIAAIPRMRQNVIAAIDSGKVANGLRSVGTAGVKAAVAAKGGAAFSNGVAAADEKFLAKFTPLLAYIDGVKRTIGSMPNVTDADRDQRMLRNVQLMRQYAGR